MFIINGEVWRVRLVPAGHPALRRPDGSVTVGCCDDSRKTIFIDENIRGRFFIEVLGYEEEELIANIVSKYGKEIINITDRMFKKMKRGYR